VKQGTVYQRHLAACPRDQAGQLLPHRCRGYWAYIIDAGRRPDGSRRQLWRSGFATKREAAQALQEEIDRRRGGLADVHALTVGTYLSSWLDGKRRLRETTRRSYAGHIRGYLTPALGRYRLTELRPHHIDQLYSDMLNGGHSGAGAARVQHVHRTLRAALNTAVKQRLIPWNPVLHVEVPEHRRSKTEIWTPTQLGRFLDHSVSHRLYALFHVIAFTGMRRGEALGLHWADVDLATGHLIIAWQVVDPGDGPRLGAPKTRSGSRIVPIDALTVEVLRGHRERQDKERESWAEAWQLTGLVFTREDGAMLRPDSTTHLFADLIRQAGVPRIRLHDLRHTHASLALAAGVDMKIVSSRLGHSSTTITADLYTHVIPAVARQAADAIAATVPLAERPSPQLVSRMFARDGLLESDPDPP
jgi:integrase